MLLKFSLAMNKLNISERDENVTQLEFPTGSQEDVVEAEGRGQGRVILGWRSWQVRCRERGIWSAQ